VSKNFFKFTLDKRKKYGMILNGLALSRLEC
jgi:hypothetical protein